MRPIVSCVNSPTYLISKWLVNEFQSFPKYSSFSVTDRFDFIDKTKNYTIEDHECFVSFDVTSLYPNVPMITAINNLEEWLRSFNLTNDRVKEYICLTNLCMNQNTFQFENNFYKQTEGTAMGNPLSCIMADIFMSKLETSAKENLPYFPRIWLRYVDDIFAVFNKEENINHFVQNINSLHASIKFTYETENMGSLPFLDLLIKKNQSTKKIEFDIFRKPTSNFRYIPNDSYHPSKQKRAAFETMIHRLLYTPLPQNSFDNELQTIKEIAVFNGYSKNLIDEILKRRLKKINKKSRTKLLEVRNEDNVWKSIGYCSVANEVKRSFKRNSKVNISFSTNNKLKFLLGNPKDKISDEEKSGIYQINCDQCDKIYIGQTRRALKTRFKEHQAHFKHKNLERSAMAKHAIEEDHYFTNVKLVKEVRKPEQLDAYETLFIKKYQNFVLNNDTGPIQNSPLL